MRKLFGIVALTLALAGLSLAQNQPIAIVDIDYPGGKLISNSKWSGLAFGEYTVTGGDEVVTWFDLELFTTNGNHVGWSDFVDWSGGNWLSPAEEWWWTGLYPQYGELVTMRITMNYWIKINEVWYHTNKTYDRLYEWEER